MQVGKLDSKLLEDIVFRHIQYKRPEVLARAGLGEDCAIVDYGEDVCVLSTDPITAAVEEIGRLAVHISCNDIASSGIEPLGIMMAVMLPPSVTEGQIETMMRQAGEEAAKLRVEIIGGHTEITEAVVQPVIVSTAIGRCKKDEYVDASRIKAGDAVIMTKMAGMEGIGILAHDYPHLLSGVLTEEELAEAKSFLREVSVRKEGLIGGQNKANGMHDVTEGGILGAVWEMCEVSGLGADVYEDEIPLAEVTRKVCHAFGIDPLRLISSGCMLIMISEDKQAQLCKELTAAGIGAARIGVMTRRDRRVISKDGTIRELEPPLSDELYRMLDAGKSQQPDKTK